MAVHRGTRFLYCVRRLMMTCFSPQDHADSAERRRSAASELPDWSQLPAEPQRPERVQRVGEVRPASPGQTHATVVSSRPRHPKSTFKNKKQIASRHFLTRDV